jgi:hypothetical protein
LVDLITIICVPCIFPNIIKDNISEVKKYCEKAHKIFKQHNILCNNTRLIKIPNIVSFNTVIARNNWVDNQGKSYYSVIYDFLNYNHIIPSNKIPNLIRVLYLHNLLYIDGGIRNITYKTEMSRNILNPIPQFIRMNGNLKKMEDYNKTIALIQDRLFVWLFISFLIYGELSNVIILHENPVPQRIRNELSTHISLYNKNIFKYKINSISFDDLITLTNNKITIKIYKKLQRKYESKIFKFKNYIQLNFI